MNMRIPIKPYGCDCGCWKVWGSISVEICGDWMKKHFDGLTKEWYASVKRAWLCASTQFPADGECIEFKAYRDGSAWYLDRRRRSVILPDAISRKCDKAFKGKGPCTVYVWLEAEE